MLLRFCLYSTITPGYLAITFLLTALPLDCKQSSREFPIRTLFRFPFLFIIQHVIFANQNKKREGVVLYSSFPARESLGLISYVTASQLLGLSPRTHFCYFLLIISIVIFAKKKRKSQLRLFQSKI